MNMILANNIELLYLVDHNEMEEKPTKLVNEKLISSNHKDVKILEKHHSAIFEEKAGMIIRNFDLSEIKPIKFSIKEKFAYLLTFCHSRRTHYNRYMTTR